MDISSVINYLYMLSKNNIDINNIYKIVSSIPIIEDTSIKTACVTYSGNAIIMKYNPIYFEELSDKYSYYGMSVILAHEACHLIQGHMSFNIKEILSRYSCTMNKLNIAADYEVNLILLEIFENMYSFICKEGILPSKKEVDEAPNGIGDVFYWLKRLSNQPNDDLLDSGSPDKSESSDGTSTEEESSTLSDGSLPTGTVLGSIPIYAVDKLLSELDIETSSINKKSSNEGVLDKYLSGISKKEYSIKSYRKLHKLCSSGVIQECTLPVNTSNKVTKLCLFIDVSSSMNPQKLSTIVPIIKDFCNSIKGELWYATVSSYIHTHKMVYDGFLNNITVGGCTEFERPLYELSKEFKYFIFFTDGEFNRFDLPVCESDQLFIIVKKGKFSYYPQAMVMYV